MDEMMKKRAEEQLIEEIEAKRALAAATEAQPANSDTTVAPRKKIELREKRTANSKVFKLEDGMEQAVFYSGNIHAYDEETDEYVETTTDFKVGKDGEGYVSGNGQFVAKFNDDKTSNELFSVEEGIHKVTVSKKKQKTSGKTKPYMRRKENAGMKTTDELVFEDAENAISMEYTTVNGGVKENIVIHTKKVEYSFPFVLTCKNVDAFLDEENGKISFFSKETGEEVFYIPAPFMKDALGSVSTNVAYELKASGRNKFELSIIADEAWINDAARELPVVIDPQVMSSGSTNMTTFGWKGNSLISGTTHQVGVVVGANNSCEINRMYLNLSLPVLPRNPRIKKAELTIRQQSAVGANIDCSCFGLYQVPDSLTNATVAPDYLKTLLEFDKITSESSVEGEPVAYTFDITELIDRYYRGETSKPNLVIKLLDETTSCNTNMTIYGAQSSSYAPTIAVTYESSYAINDATPTHSHEIGKFGRGIVDLMGGNLMFDAEDFAWSGNRMPVTIRHLYNSTLSDCPYTNVSSIKLRTADFSAMKLGNGWKLNLMQSMVNTTFIHEGVAYNGFVYVDENGVETYFKESETTCPCEDTKQCYHLYEDVNGGTFYDPCKRTIEMGSDIYQFDINGRLVMITDEYGNHMDINYTNGRITSVVDGAGRSFAFVYNNNGYLISIVAPDGTSIYYEYTGNTLNMISYPDGTKAIINYSNTKPSAVVIMDAADTNVYKVAYTFNEDRLVSLFEYGVENGAFVIGNSTAYEYSAASNRAVVETMERADSESGETKHNIIKTVYSFDDEGNVVSQYTYSEDTGNVASDGVASGINPYADGSSVVSNINNLLRGHGFETLDAWTGRSNNEDSFKVELNEVELNAKYGKKQVRLSSTTETAICNGIRQTTDTLPAGEYTFSAYLRVIEAFTGNSGSGAYIRILNNAGNVITTSEKLSGKTTEHIRLIAPFELNTAQQVTVEILTDGKGAVFADAAQLENNPYANAYNMLENGNFELGQEAWVKSNGVGVTDTDCFNMSHSLMMVGDLANERTAYQEVNVKRAQYTRETFTLSGWAKGYGIVKRERNGAPLPKFQLRAVIKYVGVSELEEHIAEFSPATEEWQFVSVEFAKERFKRIESIHVYCDYSYNFGEVYFDDIQLVRTNFEYGVSASDFTSESDEEAYEEEVVDDTLETDDYTPTFEELRDAFGNALTETNFSDGEFGTIYRSFAYNSATGNNLVKETDARGNAVQYTVDEETSRNEEIIDRCGNKTLYEYDAAGRVTKVISNDANDMELADVSYSYDAFDNMTEIARGDGMRYALAYNAYHNLDSIGVMGKNEKLVKYTYKSGNGRLKEIAYANGHKMKVSYNSIGQLVSEKWYDAEGTLIAHYKYVYDGQGNIVRSIDFFALKEYNYTYEAGVLVRAAEYSITASGEIISSKTIDNSIIYVYDEDRIVKKRIISADSTERVIYYENNDDSTVVKFGAGGKFVTSHSKNDGFGRKVFDELQLGTGFVSRRFDYAMGEVTEEHENAEKLKSTATTQLISRITFASGRTIDYEYDAEERITKVTDSLGTTTEYTYDALGQLLTEKVNDVTVNAMTYDNYGNILTKNGVAYTYGNSAWKDLLTAVGGQSISYDAQGNPVSYLGHTLTWEKGRQLKSFDGNTYTYNANGIRTSKTVNGVKHTYTLDGTKILKEEWAGNALIPLYDNEDAVCGIIYNGAPYYFEKNLQGDIISIVDADSNLVARYTYDAWGVCTDIADANGIDLTGNASHIANINSFRYRGYYFDTDINLYYLQSRYYNPSVGRFLNADEVELFIDATKPNAFNALMYCNNSPSNFTDNFGFSAIAIGGGIVISFGTAAALIALSVFTLAFIFDKNFRNAVIQLVTMIIEGVIDGIQYLANVISDCIDAAKKGKKHKGKEDHHIVAQSDYRADRSRKLLKNNDIETSSKYNIVSIKKTLHKHLHTNAYHAAVEIVLTSCAAQKKSKKDRKYALIAGLVFIGIVLKTASGIF